MSFQTYLFLLNTEGSLKNVGRQRALCVFFVWLLVQMFRPISILFLPACSLALFEHTAADRDRALLKAELADRVFFFLLIWLTLSSTNYHRPSWWKCLHVPQKVFDTFKEEFIQNWQFSHYLLTLLLFQNQSYLLFFMEYNRRCFTSCWSS